MLYDDDGNRVFYPYNSSGRTSKVVYNVDKNGEAYVISVDDVPIANEHPEFKAIVLGWIKEHRKSLSTHQGFFDIEKYKAA